MTKRAWMTSGLILSTALIATGCVPEQKYNDLLTAYKGQEQQLLTTQNELSTARSNEDRLRTQLAATMADLEELQKRLANGDIDMDAWIAKYDELKKQLASLEVSQLPPDLTRELTALQTQFPDVFDFDPKTGMLRFKNDFTFDAGSDQLKPGASAVLGKLADILNTNSAAKFEVKVVGHTDNTPVVRTKAKFGTNLMLSVYRSASLRNALVKDGVSARRRVPPGGGQWQQGCHRKPPRGALPHAARVRPLRRRPHQRGPHAGRAGGRQEGHGPQGRALDRRRRPDQVS
jgi:outer membrane protein OmpA-like peptidoglycan-associated protein